MTIQAQDIMIIDSNVNKKKDASLPRTIFETPMDRSHNSRNFAKTSNAISGLNELSKTGEENDGTTIKERTVIKI